jgi:hypothetical protein
MNMLLSVVKSNTVVEAAVSTVLAFASSLELRYKRGRSEALHSWITSRSVGTW